MTLLSSLTNRVFVASASLVVISLGLAIWRVGVSVAAQAESDLRLGLTEAASLVDDLNRTQFADFIVKGQLIADLPVLRGASATDDPPTVQPIAEEYQERMGADAFIVLGRGDRILARAGRVRIPDAEVVRVLSAVRGDADRTGFWPAAEGILHVVAIPMDAGLATLLVGSSLDRETAARVRAMTNSEIAFVFDGRIVSSSLDASSTRALAPFVPTDGTFSARLGNEDYVGLVRPLQRLAPTAGPSVAVLRSRTEHLRFLPTLRWHLAVTGLAAILLATFLAYLVARTVTRPLRALIGTMHEIAATGDLGRAIPVLGRWDDEDVRVVASTFRQLTTALNRFGQEASTRERLSSLGRLSAVVAHEIRNPLMIIKSAVRQLRRSPEVSVSELAGSIDEEVGRLDRVVASVLDLARPVAFDLAPVDLVEVCRDAVRAATVEAQGIPVELDTEIDRAPMITDGERLRGVLVNLITNARQTLGGSSLPRPSIVVYLSRANDGGWSIAVTDSGPGISPDVLPRVFEPFFTTRRGGSGLGLSIAQNVVEGLGGTITADSTLGKGTTMRIHLPDRPKAAEVVP